MPTDTQTVTAADIRRFFTGPWCERCGFNDGEKDDACRLRCDECIKLLKPGLWERLPDAKPEQLSWHERPVDHRGWVLAYGGQNNIFEIHDHHAASLCVIGIVRAVPYITFSTTAPIVVSIKGRAASATTIEEAAAIAAHRWKDAQENP